jgi:hypothetical protein
VPVLLALPHKKQAKPLFAKQGVEIIRESKGCSYYSRVCLGGGGINSTATLHAIDNKQRKDVAAAIHRIWL